MWCMQVSNIYVTTPKKLGVQDFGRYMPVKKYRVMETSFSHSGTVTLLSAYGSLGGFVPVRNNLML